MLCPELFYFDVMSDHFSFQFPARLSMAFLLPHIKRYGRLRAFFQPFLSTECCSCENVSLTQLPIVWVIVSVLNLCAAKGSASHWFTFGRLASIHKVLGRFNLGRKHNAAAIFAGGRPNVADNDPCKVHNKRSSYE